MIHNLLILICAFIILARETKVSVKANGDLR